MKKQKPPARKGYSNWAAIIVEELVKHPGEWYNVTDQVDGKLHSTSSVTALHRAAGRLFLDATFKDGALYARWMEEPK